MSKQKSNQPKHFLIFTIFLLFLISSYAPAVFEHYAYHDDYSLWYKGPSGELLPLFKILTSIGRGFGAIITLGFQHMVYTISDLNFIRLLCTISYAVCALLLFNWVRPYFTHKINAWLFTAILFTLPPFQSIVGRAVATAISLAMLLSIIAGHCTSKIYQTSTQFRWLYLFYAIGFLLLALLIYQPAAMFYWTMPAFLLLLSPPETKHNSRRRAMLHFLIIGLSSMAIYMVLLKITAQTYNKDLSGIYNPHVLDFHLFKKIIWFIHEPLFNVVNLWNIFPHKNWVIVTITFFLLSLLLSTIRLYQKKVSTKHFFNIFRIIFIFLVFIILSYSPNLLHVYPVAFYRTYLSLSTLLILLWLWNIQNLLSFLPSKIQSSMLTLILLITLSFGSYQCFKNLYLYIVLPNQIELDYATEVFKRNDLIKFNKICIIQPYYSIFGRYDDFGQMSSLYDPILVIQAALQESHKIANRALISHFILYPRMLEFPIDNSTLIFDMRKSQNLHTKLIRDSAQGGEWNYSKNFGEYEYGFKLTDGYSQYIKQLEKLNLMK
ncbi:MAG: hypothetical protein H6753_04615 [Candidatus Omnitrophica bacterium]|nr:hypothetical protein [Candidatus Omnitrophota bacterium]